MREFICWSAITAGIACMALSAMMKQTLFMFIWGAIMAATGFLTLPTEKSTK